MKAVISNVFSDDNKGGALLTRAAIHLVRALDSDADVALLLVAPDHGQQPLRHTLAEDPGLEVLQPPLAAVGERLGGTIAGLVALVYLVMGRRAARVSVPLQRLREADLVVSKGGYVFVERAGVGGLLALWITAFPLLYASRCGAATVALGGTIGPFHSRSSRWLSGFILRRVTAVVPREASSDREARGLGVEPRRVVKAPDGAFAGARSSVGSTELLGKYGLEPKRFAVLTTGYSIGSAEDDGVLVAELVRCARDLEAAELLDEVLVVLQAVSSDGSSKDRGVSEQLVAEMAPVKARLVDHDHSPDELIDLYQQALFVSGRRLHSTVFGLLAGVPSIPIVHPNEAFKARALFDDLGLGDLVADVNEAGQLCSTVRSLIAEDDTTRGRVNEAVAEAQRRWTVAVDALRNLLEVDGRLGP